MSKQGSSLFDGYYTPEDREPARKRAIKAGIDINNASEVLGFLKTERADSLLSGNCWVDENGHIQERGCGS